MARAAVPIFWPSCGSTRMIAGPPVTPPRLLSVPAIKPRPSDRGRPGRMLARRPRSICRSSFAPPGGRAVRLVLEGNAGGKKLGADPVGIGKAALLAGLHPFGDLR